MRKALFGILMAATAGVASAPALAQDGRGGLLQRVQQRAEARQERQEQRQEVRQERQQQRVERQAPVERAQRAERPAAQVEGPAVRADRQAVRADRQGQRAQRQAEFERQVQAEPVRTFQRAERQADRQDRRDDRQDRRADRRDDRTGSGNIYTDRDAYRDHVQASREASQRSADQTIGGRYARQAERNQQRYERDLRDDRREYRQDRRDYRQAQRWDRNWRNNNRYDWQRYRYSNRDLYRIGRYYSPYRDHRYSRLTIGFSLGTGFYSDRYWINDPWQYRLPHAYPGTRWIRYYDDVLLVDTYSGEVLDVIYDFFW